MICRDNSSKKYGYFMVFFFSAAKCFYPCCLYRKIERLECDYLSHFLETVVQSCSVKRVFLEISRLATLLKKNSGTGVFV